MSLFNSTNGWFFELDRPKDKVMCVIKHENTRICEGCGEKQIDNWLKYCFQCSNKLRLRQNGGVLSNEEFCSF